MAADQTSHELLSHFDRPKLADFPEFDWDESAAETEEGFLVAGPGPSTHRELASDQLQPPQHQRGVRWVLKWTAAAAVLLLAADVLAGYFFSVALERSLDRAARAGATEATLPRASSQSVADAVGRRLADYPQLRKKLNISLLQNGRPVTGQLLAGDGDRFTVVLSAHASSCMPNWLVRADEAPIVVQQESSAQSRKLKR